MLGHIYHTEPSNERIQYEIVSEPTRLNLVTIWKYNRPPDPQRVKEIEEYITESGMCDGQILLAVVDGNCVCYDGAHRLMACKRVFPRGGVQVRIQLESNDTEIRKEFERINRSIPVPELYFSSDEVSKRVSSLCYEVSKKLCEFYSGFTSTSRHPKRPNFNRDIFAEELGTVLQEKISSETLMTITIETIGDWLMKMNTQILAEHHTGKSRIKAPDSILKKCEQSKFYLFATDWKAEFRKMTI